LLTRIFFYLTGIILFVFCSCHEQKADGLSTTPAFDSVFIAADKLSDSGFREKALAIVMNAHSNMQHLATEDEINYYSYCNIIYNHDGKHDNSIALADSMLMVLDKAKVTPNVQSWRIVAYNIKADALFARGMYHDAYNYYHLAQKMAIENRDSCSLRTYTYSLAMTLYRQQRYQQSAARFKEALQQSMPCNEDFNLFYFKQELMDNIGLCYNAMKKYDSALYYYDIALNYLNERTGMYPHKQESVYEAPKAVIYGNMAEVYVHLGKFDSATALYEHSIGINLQKGYTNTDALVDQIKLVDLYFKTNEFEKARITLNNIEAELDSIPDKKSELMWHKLKWRYCEHTGDSLCAFRHLRTYTVQHEIYQHENKELMETDLDMRVKDLEKQYKINLLLKDKDQQKLYLIVVTVLALMAIVIVFMMLRNTRRSQKNVKLLTALNNKVNEQKEQLEVALEGLRMKEKDKTRILKSVAHDVMNPIAAIVSLADILSHEGGNLTPEQVEVLNLIKEASNNSLNLSRDILEASEEIDEHNMQKENTDINNLVFRSVELLNFRAHEKSQQIHMDLPATHVFAFVYKDKIRRVINNILNNAIKFSFENSVIELKLQEKDGVVEVIVKDSGVGIADNHKAHIFDMFTEAKLPGTSGEVPHGLGLSISLQIARAHNGDIWFESQKDKGSTFHFVFPVNSETPAS
jgi:signal transduction histidine kinase